MATKFGEDQRQSLEDSHGGNGIHRTRAILQIGSPASALWRKRDRGYGSSNRGFSVPIGDAEHARRDVFDDRIRFNFRSVRSSVPRFRSQMAASG
jgi:hypothetical protein